MTGNTRRLIRANAAETVAQPRLLLPVFTNSPLSRPEIGAVRANVTRSRIMNERITAGRLGGPFLEIT